MGAARSKDGTTYPVLKRSNSEGDEPSGPFDNRPGSFHEQLVRQRDRGHNFDDIYEVCNEIGHGGLCKIFKVRKYDDKIGGSSRPRGVRTKTKLIRDSLRGKIRSNNDLMSALEQGKKKESSTSLSIKDLSARANGGKAETDDDNDEPTIPKPERLGDRTKSAPVSSSSSSSPSGMYFALKVINLALVKEDQIDQLQNEVEILKTLDHKNIIKAYETFQMRKHKKLMIVMELCTGGDMYARMPYTERQVGSAMRQVLSAIAYMHQKHIIHRDLKLENIIWESEHPEAMVKVIDFGLSKQYSPQNNILTERVGTLYSMSPETMKGDYTAQADLWSLGVCTYIMLCMSKPFEGQTPKQLVANVLQCNYEFKSAPLEGEDGDNVWDKISDSAKSFISQLLVLEPEKRLSADKAKNHEWFAHCGFGKGIVNKQSSLSDHDNAEVWAQHPIGAPLLEEDEEEADDEDLGEIAVGNLDELLGNDDGNSDEDDSNEKRRAYVSPFTSEEFKDRVRANMVEYAEMGEFRRLALNVIAKKSTSSQIFEIRKVFDEFDTNNTGTITVEEFKAALAQFEYSEEDVMEIFRKIDINKSNEINYTEFLAAALETQGTIEEYRLAEAFDMLDSDDSGYISKENLRQLLGKKADERYIDALIAEADFKKDGKISYQEFLQLFSQRTQQHNISTIYERSVSMDLDEEADKVLQKHGFVIKFRPYSKTTANEDGKTAPATPTGGGRGIRRFLPATPSSARRSGAVNGTTPPRTLLSTKDSSGSSKGELTPPGRVTRISPPASPGIALPLTGDTMASLTTETSENEATITTSTGSSGVETKLQKAQ